MQFQSKTQIQDYAVKLSETYHRIIFEIATGGGKSLAAIRIIERVRGNWCIIIAEINHELNWRNEFILHGKEHLLQNITFKCYASIHKDIKDEHYILDEVHRVFSENRLESLKKIIHIQHDKYLIGLSATLTRTQKDILKIIIGEHYNFKITISQAVQWGLLPKPSIYLVPVQLNNTIKNHTFSFNKDKVIKCTEKEKYDFISGRIDYFKKKYFDTRIDFDKIKWLSAGNTRKKFLSECKTKFAKILIEKLKNKRFICFTGSIKQSEELSKGLSIHSGINKKGREKLITQFNSGEIDYIFTTNMLREGMNLHNIEAGILVQLDNQEKNMIQQLGRTMRSLIPEFYVLYVEDTQDFTYLTTATEGLNKEYVATINLEDI
jgi:superfamily II DNA or RNA helicase